MTADDQADTQVEQVPPHETTGSPVDVTVAMPRYFGVTPPTLLFGVATATLAIAIMLAAFGHWLAALVLAIVVLLEIAAFLSIARRKPDTAVARVSVGAIRRVRERALWLAESTSVRSETGRRLTRLRYAFAELAEQREKRLRDLGAAVYEDDRAAADELKQELRRIDDERETKEEEMRAIAEAAEERLRTGRLRVEQTVVRPPEDSE
jgi:type IV secretory pathway VirB3-like protein